MNKIFKNFKFPCDVSEWIKNPEDELMNKLLNDGMSYDDFIGMFIGEWKVMTDEGMYEIEMLNKENRDKTRKLK